MELINKIVGSIFPGFSISIGGEGAGDGLLRKVAHFTEFMILGIEITTLVYRVLRSNVVLPPFCGLLVAMIDETIQLYSVGRSSKVSDVWIDFGGVMVGFIIIIYLFSKESRKRGDLDSNES